MPADIELLEATEKHDMMKFCALLHQSGELNDVPVQDHRRDRGKTHLPKKPNLVGGPAFLTPDQTELLKTSADMSEDAVFWVLTGAGRRVARQKMSPLNPAVPSLSWFPTSVLEIQESFHVLWLTPRLLSLQCLQIWRPPVAVSTRPAGFLLTVTHVVRRSAGLRRR